MTEHDPVDAVIAAYHDYLENGGTEPSLDHLDEDQRREAAELIDLIKDVRGVDFYRSAPSLDTLLAGTDLEHKPAPDPTPPHPAESPASPGTSSPSSSPTKPSKATSTRRPPGRSSTTSSTPTSTSRSPSTPMGSNTTPPPTSSPT